MWSAPQKLNNAQSQTTVSGGKVVAASAPTGALVAWCTGGSTLNTFYRSESGGPWQYHSIPEDPCDTSRLLATSDGLNTIGVEVPTMKGPIHLRTWTSPNTSTTSQIAMARAAWTPMVLTSDWSGNYTAVYCDENFKVGKSIYNPATQLWSDYAVAPLAGGMSCAPPLSLKAMRDASGHMGILVQDGLVAQVDIDTYASTQSQMVNLAGFKSDLYLLNSGHALSATLMDTQTIKIHEFNNGWSSAFELAIDTGRLLTSGLITTTISSVWRNNFVAWSFGTGVYSVDWPRGSTNVSGTNLLASIDAVAISDLQLSSNQLGFVLASWLHKDADGKRHVCLNRYSALAVAISSPGKAWSASRTQRWMY